MWSFWLSIFHAFLVTFVQSSQYFLSAKSSLAADITKLCTKGATRLSRKPLTLVDYEQNKKELDSMLHDDDVVWSGIIKHDGYLRSAFDNVPINSTVSDINLCNIGGWNEIGFFISNFVKYSLAFNRRLKCFLPVEFNNERLQYKAICIKEEITTTRTTTISTATTSTLVTRILTTSHKKPNLLLNDQQHRRQSPSSSTSAIRIDLSDRKDLIDDDSPFYYKKYHTLLYAFVASAFVMAIILIAFAVHYYYKRNKLLISCASCRNKRKSASDSSSAATAAVRRYASVRSHQLANGDIENSPISFDTGQSSSF